jgi:hypothetical protein
VAVKFGPILGEIKAFDLAKDWAEAHDGQKCRGTDKVRPLKEIRMADGKLLRGRGFHLRNET